MTRDSGGVTCEGVAVVGASQPQLSVHDSGNSKLGYSWPGLPAATWPPLLCHTGTLSPAAAPPWLHHRHHSRLVTRREIRTLLGCGEWSRWRQWRQGPHSSSAVLQCCSAAGGVTTPGPGQRAAWEPSLHILTPEAGYEQKTPSCVEVF